MKVYSPNKGYTGITASIPFCGGVGETEDPHLIQWFKEHGYQVEEKPEEPEEHEKPEEEPKEPEKDDKESKKKVGK